MADLAIAYWHLGRYRDAEVLQMKALELNKEVSGEHQSFTIRCMGNVAAVWAYHGRYEESVALQLEVLALEASSGKAHLNTATTLSNLGQMFQDLS